MADGAPALFDLRGRTALVTGCRRGIGQAIAVALAEAGADIIGVSAHLEPDGGAVGGRVRAAGRSFVPYAVDLADPAGVTRLLGELDAGARGVDILVNNAGTVHRAPAVDHPTARWEEVVGLNLSAPFVLTREVARAMLARGTGKIVFVASLLSFQGGVNVVSYAASKSGIAGLTRALANEWAPQGVNVNALAPGYIETDFTRDLHEDQRRRDEILVRIPAGRWGRPADLAGAAVFLASAASDYVHGSVLPVDGGWLAR